MSPRTSPYAFDNDSVHADDQLALLGELLDPFTTRRLERLGVAQGWQCLEVGAGAGTVANWLADRVGIDGHVTATDIKPQRIVARDNLTARRHNIVTDALPVRTYDLVHARLVLMHLPQRQMILDRLLMTLKPDGVLLLDEFDVSYAPVLEVPEGADPELFGKFNDALMAHLTSAGANVSWGRHASAAMRLAGYADVQAEAELQIWRGGSPGCRLHHSNSLQLNDGLIASGMTARELGKLREQLAHPRFSVAGYPIYSISARTPPRDHGPW